MATVHLICGPIGAAKTTTAGRLARQHRAVRFSLDAWVMQRRGGAMRCNSSGGRTAASASRDESGKSALSCSRDVDVILDFALALVVTEQMFRDSEAWREPPSDTELRTSPRTKRMVNEIELLTQVK
jgi:hypothetical protein